MSKYVIRNNDLPGDTVSINAEPGMKLPNGKETSGEFVVNSNATAAFGPMLEYMNNAVPRHYSKNNFALGQEGKAHESINMLMVKSTLANMLPPESIPQKIEANEFASLPISDSPVRQRVDATRNMQEGGEVEGRRLPMLSGLWGERSNIVEDEKGKKIQMIYSIPAGQVGEGGAGQYRNAEEMLADQYNKRYYLGESDYYKTDDRDYLRQVIEPLYAKTDARIKMAYSPADSIPQAMVENYFNQFRQEEAPVETPKKKSRLRSLLGMQNGGPVSEGLKFAESYEYNPTKLESLLDKVPGIGGKRAYNRARDYYIKAHHNPDDMKKTDENMKQQSYVRGKRSRHQSESSDRGLRDVWQSRDLVHNPENPREFSYRNIVEDMDKGMIDQFILGSDVGHVVEEDDYVKHAIDPSNIAKFDRGKDLLGFIPMGYSGSVKQNPGIDPYIDVENLAKQVGEVDAEKINMQNGGEVEDEWSPTTMGGKLHKFLAERRMNKFMEQDPQLKAWYEQPHEIGTVLPAERIKANLYDTQSSINDKVLNDYSRSLSEHTTIEEGSPFEGVKFIDFIEGGTDKGRDMQYIETDKGRYRLAKTHQGGILDPIRNFFGEIPKRVDMDKPYEFETDKPYGVDSDRLSRKDKRDLKALGRSENLNMQEDLNRLSVASGGMQEGGQVPSGNWGPKGAYNEALQKAREEEIGSKNLKSLGVLEMLRLINASTGEQPERLEQLNPERQIKIRESIFNRPDSNEYNMPTFQGDSGASRTPVMKAPSDNYGGNQIEKNLDVLIPYLQSYGRIKTPLQQKNEFLYNRLGVNPEQPPPSLQGLQGSALLQRLGSEGI